MAHINLGRLHTAEGSVVGVQVLPGGASGVANCATVITQRNPHGRTAATQQARTILVTTEGTSCGG